MEKFNEFDLDVKKVSGDFISQSKRGKMITFPCEVTYQCVPSLNKKCISVDVPTGGATRQCCSKKNDVEPKCI